MHSAVTKNTGDITIKKNAGKIIKNNRCPIFMADSFLRFQEDKWMDERALPFRKVYPNEKNHFEHDFSMDITEGICNANSVAYYALQIAVYMGFEEICLLGMDNGDWGLHFDEEYLEEADIFRENFDEIMESRMVSRYSIFAIVRRIKYFALSSNSFSMAYTGFPR